MALPQSILGAEIMILFLFAASKILKAESPDYAIPHFHFKAAGIFSLWSTVSML